MTEHDTIPTPLPLMVRRVRYQVLPVATLLISAALAGWLWTRRGGGAGAVGEVNIVRMSVTTKSDGVLVDIPRKVQVFDFVRAGEIIARLDNSVHEAQIGKLQGEIDQMKAELDTMAQAHAKAKGPTTAPGAPAGGNARSASSAPLAFPTADADGEDEATEFVPRSAPALRIAIANREAKIRAIEQKILNHDIKAPISGTIISIERGPGQAIQAGHALLTIAAEKPDYIVSYIRQAQSIQPAPGMPVDVRLRSLRKLVRSHVQSVGPQLERVPEEQLRDHKNPEWGLPVHIAIPPGTPLRPGELVDLFFRPAGIAEGS